MTAGAVRVGAAVTVLTRAGAGMGDELGRRLGVPVQALVLDGESVCELEALLGPELERYASGFDRHELTLAVLPRLLSRARETAGSEEPVLYVDGWSADLTSPAPAPGDRLRIDPWPPRETGEGARLDAVLLPGGSWPGELLARWSDLIEQLLAEDRALTPHTTVRWLRALALALTGGEPASAKVVTAPPGRVTAQPGPTADEPAYGFSRLPCGLPLTSALRRALRAAQREGRFLRPFSTPEPEALRAWLAEPDTGGGELPRYLSRLRELRGDLSATFSRTPEGDAGLLGWARREGRGEDPVLAEIVPPAPSCEETSPSPPAGIAPAALPWGVNIVSYWHSELGTADAARLVVRALDAAGVPLLPVPVSQDLPPSRRRQPFLTGGERQFPFGLNLLCLNGPGVCSFARHAGSDAFDGRLTVGYWWWEVIDGLPGAWREAFELLDAIWVGSEHVRAAVQPSSPVPVELMPIPVLPLPPARPRAELGLPDGFLFICAFDYHSAYERKNPAAVVRAFRAAFPPGSGASLVVKSINSSSQPDNRDELQILAAGHPDIHLLDGYLPAPAVDSLLACADCLVSLHRAEGFGIPLARALRSGIPVVATAYSGNLDFMTAENSYLVEWVQAPVPEGTFYPTGALWAEPDLEHAAAQLRTVFERSTEASERARRAAVSLARTHSPEHTGAAMSRALRRLHARLPRATGKVAPRAPLSADAVAELRRLIAADARPPDGVADRVARALSPGGGVGTRAAERDARLLELLARLSDTAEQQAGVLVELERLVADLGREKLAAVDLAAVLRGLRDEPREGPESGS